MRRGDNIEEMRGQDKYGWTVWERKEKWQNRE